MWLILVVILIIVVIACLLLMFSPLRATFTFNKHPIIYSEADIARLIPKVDAIRQARSDIASQISRSQDMIDFRLLGTDNQVHLSFFPSIKTFLDGNVEVRNAFIYRPEHGMSQTPNLTSGSKLIRYQLILDGSCQAMIGGVYYDMQDGSQTLFDADVTHVILNRGGRPLILVLDISQERHPSIVKIRRTLHRILGVPKTA